MNEIIKVKKLYLLMSYSWGLRTGSASPLNTSVGCWY